MVSIFSRARGSILAVIMVVFGIGIAFGEEGPPAVREGLAKVVPGVSIDSVRETPMAGLYEVKMGPQLVYVSGDGRFLVQGSLYDIDNRKDLTEDSRAAARLSAIKDIGEDKMVIFSPEEVKHTVTVFTDIDCGYCRKLHSEIDQYLSRGIRVRYLFFPRAGIDSPSYNKAVSVWCADDRNQALTDAKSGKPVEQKTCDNPVAEDYLLGELMGVTGTPALLLEDGELIPGYIPAAKLYSYMEAKKAHADIQAQTASSK